MIRAIARFFALHIVWVEIFCRGFSFACVSSQFVNPRSVVILFVVDMTSCFSSVVALWYAVASDLIHLPSPPWDFPAGHLWGHRRVYTLNYTTSIPLDIAMEYAMTPLSLVCMCFLMVIFRLFWTVSRQKYRFYHAMVKLSSVMVSLKDSERDVTIFNHKNWKVEKN